MGKTDKLLFVIVTALIFLSIAWFAQFSQAQLNLSMADYMSQFFDNAKAENAGLINSRSADITVYDACLKQPFKRI